jgi:hypothetical protein
MKMFSPFQPPGGGAAGTPRQDRPGETGGASLTELNERINALQQQIEALSKGRKE